MENPTPEQIQKMIDEYVVLVPVKGYDQVFKVEYTFRYRKENWLKTDREWISSAGKTIKIGE